MSKISLKLRYVQIFERLQKIRMLSKIKMYNAAMVVYPKQISQISCKCAPSVLYQDFWNKFAGKIATAYFYLTNLSRSLRHKHLGS